MLLFDESDRGGLATLVRQDGLTSLTTARSRNLIFILWGVWIVCVVIGSLSPGVSPVMSTIGRLHIDDKMLHFCAYLGLSLLPAIAFRKNRRGIAAGLAMFVLGILLEATQHFSPGRSVEFGDIIANGAGVGCGVVMAHFSRRQVVF